MHNYRELKIWQQSKGLVKEVYKLSSSLPDEERYGLVQQIRRSAVSIPSNIAEGAGRGTDKDFAHFLSQSLGSAYELETQLEIACDLKFVSKESTQEIFQQLNEIQKMINAFRKKLKTLEISPN